MKKLLIVICISAFLASCGGDTKSTDVTKDSTTTTTTTTDSSKMSGPAADTTHKDSTTTKMTTTDSTKK